MIDKTLRLFYRIFFPIGRAVFFIIGIIFFPLMALMIAKDEYEYVDFVVGGLRDILYGEF